MNNELLEALEDIFEEDNIKPEDELRKFENWDSLAVISIVAICDRKFGVTISAEGLKKIITVSELNNFILSNKNR